MKLRLATLLLSSVVACSAEPPEDDIDFAPDGGTEEELPEGAFLDIDPPQSPTHWDAAVFTGRGPAGGTVLVHSPVAGQLSPVQTGSTGEFCIDVPLQLGTTNTISFQAVSADGQMSDMVIREVTQQGEPPEVEDDNGGQQQLVPLDGTFTVHDETTTNLPDGGSFASLFNGNENDVMVLDEAAFSSIDWIAFELPERIQLHEIDLIGSELCPGSDDNGALEDFEIYVSDHDNFDNLYFSSGFPDFVGWTRVASISDNTEADLNIVPSPQDTMARHFAIRFLSNDCASLFQDGKHPLAEVALYSLEDVDPSGTPTSGAPSCASGGY